jgi:hypothetical protein
MHQNSRLKRPTPTKAESRCLEPLRYSRKICKGRGLYLLVMPNGSRYWRYSYRFQGKHKTLALGIYPDISLDRARARHQGARLLLADGPDPSARKRALGKYALVITRTAPPALVQRREPAWMPR